MGSSDNRDSGNISVFIAGALVGAGVALLLAPRSGSQMRGLLRDYAARAQDTLGDAVDRGMEAWDDAKERGQEFLEKGIDLARETSDHVKESAKATKPAK